MGKRREDCQTFPKEVRALFLQTQLLQCDITPDGKWNEVSVTRMCHTGAVFYIQISQSALVRKGVNPQQSRKLPVSREAWSWHRKLWECFWSKVLAVGKELRDREEKKKFLVGLEEQGLYLHYKTVVWLLQSGNHHWFHPSVGRTCRSTMANFVSVTMLDMLVNAWGVFLSYYTSFSAQRRSAVFFQAQQWPDLDLQRLLQGLRVFHPRDYTDAL